MKLSDILNPTELERLIGEHYITRVQHPTLPLALLNYSEKATYDRVWTPETRQSRGLVYDVATGEIIAWPFNKFFNVGENEDTALAALAARPGPVEVTDKLDGSMVALWWYDGAWHASTRGSFVSSQAQAALRWVERRGFHDWSRDFTLIGEWTAPDNRVVLKYATAELVLIGARHLRLNEDADHLALQVLGDVTGLRVVPRLTDTSLEALMARRETECGIEGWVVRWTSGFRVKVKCEDYLRLHRLFSGFGPGRIRESMLDGTLDRYLTELPEELRAEAESMRFTLTHAYTSRMAHLINTHARLTPVLAESRKAFALAVQQEPVEDRSYLFLLADGKPIDTKLLTALDLLVLFGAVEEPVL